MGRVAGEVIARQIALPQVITPPAPGVTPAPAPPAPVAPEELREFIWEETLAPDTEDREIRLGIDAKVFNIRTDRDIMVKFFKNYTTIPSSESPFNAVFPVPVSRVYVTAAAGADVKMIASNMPIKVSFGRAKLEGSGIQSLATLQSYWYWTIQISHPANTYVEWIVAGSDGNPYTVPENKRLIIDLVTLSSDVKGAVQQVDLIEYKSDGSNYRFGGAFFDCVVPLKMRVPLAEGSQIGIRTYNWDIDDRIIWVVINGWEEYL